MAHLPGVVWKRDGASAEMSCQGASEVWSLTCKGTSWQGYHGNCTVKTDGQGLSEYLIIAFVKHKQFIGIQPFLFYVSLYGLSTCIQSPNKPHHYKKDIALS